MPMTGYAGGARKTSGRRERIDSMPMTSTPWRIAHRGARREAPDNTAPALIQAMTYPIDGVEFDIQMSADGELLLYHDRTLWRLARVRKRLSQLSFRELQQFDWGKWFSPAFAGEPPLTFEAALELLEQCPRLLVEIKSNPRDRESGHVRQLTKTALDVLKRSAFRSHHDRIFILSFDPDVLALSHALAPEFRCVFNCAETDPSALAHLSSAWFDSLWAIDLAVGKLTDRWARWARSRQLRLMSYTCNTTPQVQKALARGVDAIITDRPAWLADYLAGQSAGDS